MTMMYIKPGDVAYNMNITPGWKLLPIDVGRRMEAYRKLEAGELNTHPLIKEISAFDVTYMYSDDVRAYRAGAAHEQELREKIDASEDFSDDDKVFLAAGLAVGSTDKFLNRFEYARISSQDSEVPPLYRKLINGEFDEDRLINIQTKMNTLSALWDRNLPVEQDRLVVHTHATRNPKNVRGKMTLSQHKQQLVYKFEYGISKEDLAFYNEWISTAIFYGRVPVTPGSFDHHIVEMTALERYVHMFYKQKLHLADSSVIFAHEFLRCGEGYNPQRITMIL